MADNSVPSDVRAVILNIVGGALVVLLTWGYASVSRICRRWAQKRLMGADFDPDGQYKVVYGSFVLPLVYDQSGKRITHPYVKTPLPPTVPRQLAPMGFSIDSPVSSGEMRGAAYLAEFFGKSRVCPPLLVPDNEVLSHVDLSFISLGGPGSNLKTEDALMHPVNSLVTFGTGGGFVKPGTQVPVVQITPDPLFDYGMILRISPSQHPRRTWIVCAGIGEWGTSGACWFLAHKWRQLFWHVLRGYRRQYAGVVKVRRGQDESAELIWKA